MANKKNIENRNLSTEELQGELATLESQMVKLSFDHAATGLDNPMVLRETRRDISRLKTDLRRREIEAMKPEDHAGRSAIVKRRRSSK